MENVQLVTFTSSCFGKGKTSFLQAVDFCKYLDKSVRGGTRHKEGMMACGATQIVQVRLKDRYRDPGTSPHREIVPQIVPVVDKTIAHQGLVIRKSAPFDPHHREKIGFVDCIYLLWRRTAQCPRVQITSMFFLRCPWTVRNEVHEQLHQVDDMIDVHVLLPRNLSDGRSASSLRPKGIPIQSSSLKTAASPKPLETKSCSPQNGHKKQSRQGPDPKPGADRKPQSKSDSQSRAETEGRTKTQKAGTQRANKTFRESFIEVTVLGSLPFLGGSVLGSAPSGEISSCVLNAETAVSHWRCERRQGGSSHALWTPTRSSTLLGSSVSPWALHEHSIPKGAHAPSPPPPRGCHGCQNFKSLSAMLHASGLESFSYAALPKAPTWRQHLPQTCTCC